VGFEGEGLDLIKEVKSLNPDCKVMLVSDHEDAQEDAERAGAIKGFGKSEMGSPQLAKHVKQALD
jgi:DNA-binding NarL/FixJ family response regulator